MEKLNKFLFILPITVIFASAVLADNPGEEEAVVEQVEEMENSTLLTAL